MAKRKIRARDIDIRDVRQVVVSPDADLARIMDRLPHGQLWATSRDIVALDPVHSSLWLLVGAQLRRVSRAMSGRPRQEFLEVLIRSAFRDDRVNLDYPDLLIEALASDDFGEDHDMSMTYLDCRRFTTGCKLTITARNEESPLWRQSLAVRLTVTPSGVVLTEPHIELMIDFPQTT